MGQKPKNRKSWLRGVLIVVLFFQIFFFVTPRQVLAQSPDVVAWLTTDKVQKELNLSSKQLLGATLYQALLNAVQFFLQKIAYDGAVWIASGGKGQGALVFSEGWGKYLENTALDAAGDAIGEISDKMNTFAEGAGIPGFDICNPSASISLKINLGIAKKYNPPVPKCSWSQIEQNWETFSTTFETGAVLKNLGVSFEGGQSGLSTALAINQKSLTKVTDKIDAAITTRTEGNGFKGVTSIVTGDIKTPGQVVQENFKKTLEQPEENRKTNVSAAFFNKDVGFAVLKSVLSTFINTLANQLLNRVQTGFFASDLLPKKNITNPEAAAGGGSREAAKQIFSSLTVPNIQTIDTYDVLGDFVTCPAQNRGQNNCVIDDSFAAAVRQAGAGASLTVGEAIAQKLIDDRKPLIPATDQARNQDSYCYTYGYCYSNLVKLRRARILPIGWELAASSPYNSAAAPVSLAEVINGFQDCNTQGEIDAQHKWCHLIDPNWVLKYPLTQCRALVDGPALADSAGDGRTQVCVDSPTCNAEDGKGNCIGGWGYCTRERNIWRFGGTECPAYYNTCQQFSDSTGNQLTLRTNTVEAGICSADNAGCRWYSQNQEAVADPKVKVCQAGQNMGKLCTVDTDCPGSLCVPNTPPFVQTPFPQTLAWQPDNRIYFNRNAVTCDASNAGCTEVIPKKNGVTLNLIRNSSFETDASSPTGPDFWDGTPVAYSTDATQSFQGARAVEVNDAQVVSQRVSVNPSRFYTISINGRRSNTNTPTTAGVRLSVFKISVNGFDTIDVGPYFTNCAKGLANNELDLHFDSALDSSGNAAYSRQSCTFTAPKDAAVVRVKLYGGAGNAAAWIDAVQLEESEFVTNYTEGYGGSGANSKIYLKVPPPELCTGGPADPAICGQYAAVCLASEVGCELYKPTNGEPAIPGIARNSDQCPAECVGYQTFREEPTNFNPSGAYPLYFIPDTAQVCSADNAGCDEFTNLTGSNPEAREYYKYLRLCEKPEVQNDTTGTYYTWEGTEASGFQIRVWQLKKSNVTGDAAPCTKYNGQANVCDDAGLVAPDNCNERGDIFTNPDCREFYDVNGYIHYRLYSKTITKSNDCVDYRKTTQTQNGCQTSGGKWDAVTTQCSYRVLPNDSLSCPASENLCRLYTGNTGNNIQNFVDNAFEAGNVGSFENATISNESIATTGHSLSKQAGSATIRVPIELNNLAKQTVLVSFWAKGTPQRSLEVNFKSANTDKYFAIPDNNPTTPSAELSSDWRYYQLGPIKVDWNTSNLPQTCAIVAACSLDGGCVCQNQGKVQCQVSKGQTSCKFDYFQITVKSLDGTSSDANAQLFLDNLKIQVVRENLAVIKDSWKTPASCDATPEGAYKAQYMLGCTQYTDRASNPVNLKSFTQLCREKAIGCQAFFNTHNSASPYTQSWNYICIRPNKDSGACSIDPDGAGPAASRQVCTIAPGSDRCTFNWEGDLIDPNPNNNYSSIAPTINLKFIDGTGVLGATLPVFYDVDLTVVPADSTDYLVDSPTKRCQPDAKGCQSLGQPKFNAAQTAVDSYDDTYKLNLPDKYAQTLCTNTALFCDAWGTADGAERYFKNPLNKTCEYKASSSGGEFGWFQTGTSTPCYSNFTIAGNERGIWTSTAICALPNNATCNNVNGCACPGGGSVTQCTVANGLKSCTPFTGWAGLCSQEAISCTEFLDPADTGLNKDTGYRQWPDGHPYDYIKDTKITNEGQSITEKCEGASLKGGCILFNDTSNPVLTFNAAATYLKSDKDGFKAEAPIDCASGSSDAQTYCHTCDTTTTQYCAKDSDCPITNSVQEKCNQNVVKNDSNSIFKVRRDRDCAEWLACNSPQPIFDPRQNKVIMACSSLDLCNAPSTTKDLSSCRYVLNKPTPQVLDDNVYAKRDISWFGSEYSGYSIPNLYPIDTLRSVNVGACVDINYSAESVVIPEGATSTIKACNNDKDCAKKCENTNDSCQKDADCKNGVLCKAVERCVSHYRLARVLGPCPASAPETECHIYTCSGSSQPCSNNADCSPNHTCQISDQTKIGDGICYANQCVQPPTGMPEKGTASLTDSSQSEPPSCRAYPEENSPFPSSKVVANRPDAWNNHDPATKLDDTPISVANGFQNAQLCAKGEACECNYRKLTYGGVFKYISENTSTSDLLGICSSGPHKGQACSSNDDCTEWTDPVKRTGPKGAPGECNLLERNDRLIGLPGYCLERDLSSIINGDSSGNPDSHGCLTWLPIDQLAGLSSLYNQYVDAGWNVDVNQQWYCKAGDKVQYPYTRATTQAGPVMKFEYDRGVDGIAANRDLISGDINVSKTANSNYFGEPTTDLCPDAEDSEMAACIGKHMDGGSGDIKNDSKCSDSDQWCLWPQRLCNGGWRNTPGTITDAGNSFCPREAAEAQSGSSFDCGRSMLINLGDAYYGGTGPNNDQGYIKYQPRFIFYTGSFPLPGPNASFCFGPPKTINSEYESQANKERGGTNDAAHAQHGTNFLGCYQFGSSDNDVVKKQIRYPWNGPPIYDWQIENFDVTFHEADETCSAFTGTSSNTINGFGWGKADNDDIAEDVAGKVITFQPAQSMKGSILNTKKGTINIFPVWKTTGAGKQLAAIGVGATTDSSQGIFFIESFAIHFWPSCLQSANVGKPNYGNNAAYTDRLLRSGSFVYPTDPNGYVFKEGSVDPDKGRPVSTGTENTPWAAICRFTDNGRPLVVNNIALQTKQCSLVGQTNALYRETTQGGDYRLRNLFARSNDVEVFQGVDSTAKLLCGIDPEHVDFNAACGGGGNNQNCTYPNSCKPVSSCTKGLNAQLNCENVSTCINNDPKSSSSSKDCTKDASVCLGGETCTPQNSCTPVIVRCVADQCQWCGNLPGATKCAVAGNSKDNNKPFKCTVDQDCKDKSADLTPDPDTTTSSCGNPQNKCQDGSKQGKNCNGDPDCSTTCQSVTSGRIILDPKPYPSHTGTNGEVVKDNPSGVSAPITFRYETTNDVTLKWDETDFADGGSSNAPQVHAAINCQANGACSEEGKNDAANQGLAINNQSFDDVGGGKVQTRADLKFFMHATPNRMPISAVGIDWGDNTPVYYQLGSYLNTRETCDAVKDQLLAGTIGYTSDSCTNKPVEVMHDYKCSQTIIASLPACDANGRPNPVTGYHNGGGNGGCQEAGKCIYVPRVNVRDNWGWCASQGNIGCKGDPGGDGCFDGSNNKVKEASTNECSALSYPSSAQGKTEIDPWIYFRGRIVVAP